MSTYAFTARKVLSLFNFKIYDEIKQNRDKDAVGVFVVCDEKEAKNVRKYFPEREDIVIESFSAYINKHWNEYNVSMLAEIEKKYDASPIWKYIYTDRILINRDYDYCVKITCGLYDFWDYLFTKYSPRAYYDEAISTLFTFSAYQVGLKTGTRFFSQLMVRGNNMEFTYHYLLDEPLQHNAYFNENYKNESYTDEEVKAATDFLDNFRKSDVKPLYMKIQGKEPRLTFKMLLGIPFYFKQIMFNKYNRDKASYFYYRQQADAMAPIGNFFRYQKSKKYYQQPDLSEKFVLYGLHFQPEASTIVCAQKYEKQMFFLDNLAKSLPADTVLYVKEHYAGLGTRPIEFYEQLKLYPNIKLISPWANGRQLIEHAQCVVTLTGTMGWEAFLLGKPVIMSGDIFYTNAPGVIKTDDIYQNYLSLLNNWAQPTRDEIIQYLCEYIRSARKGNTYGASDLRFEEKNVKLVVDSYMEYLEKKGV